MITVNARGGVVTTRNAVTGVTSSVSHDYAPHTLKKTRPSGALQCEPNKPTVKVVNTKWGGRLHVHASTGAVISDPMLSAPSRPLTALAPPVYKQPVRAPIVVPYLYQEYPRYVTPHASWIVVKLPPEQPLNTDIKPSVFDTLVARLVAAYGENKVVIDRKKKTVRVNVK